MNVLLGAACSCLGLHILDSISQRHAERDFFQSGQSKVTIPKTLLFLARYLGLIVHIINGIVSILWKVKYDVIPIQHCQSWLIYQNVAIPFLLAVLDMILLLRVYALYGRSRLSHILLVIFFFAKCAFGIAVSIVVMSETKNQYDRSCIMVSPDATKWSLCFATIEITFQLILLFSVFGKRISGWRFGLNSLPVLNRLSKDASMVLLVSCVPLIIAGVMLYFAKHTDWALTVFPILALILSYSACRLILNLQYLAVNLERSSQDCELTWVDDASWDLRTFISGDTEVE